MKKEHDGHQRLAIEDIASEHRNNLSKDIETKRREFQEWTKCTATSDEELKMEISRIENKRVDAKKEIQVLFDDIQNRLIQKRDELWKSVDLVAEIQSKFVRKTIENRQEVIRAFSVFDDIANDSDYEMMNKKLNKTGDISKNLKYLKSEFQYNSLEMVHQFSLQQTESVQTIYNNIPTIARVKAPVFTSMSRMQPLGSGKKAKSNQDFRAPWDVAVSRTNIFVSDCDNNRIQVFDLKSKKFVRSLAVSSRFMCVERVGEDEYLIVSCYDHCVRKYEIALEGKVTPIWEKRSISNATGVVVKIGTPNRVYVCDLGNGGIQILNSENGRHINTINCDQPYCIAIVHDTLVVTNLKKGVFIFDKVWKKQFEIANASGICFDETNNRLIVSNQKANQVHVIDWERKQIVETVKDFHTPMGICYNTTSRELFVADRWHHQIQVFQYAD